MSGEHENPNPRSWRSADGWTFVDLGSVQFARRHVADDGDIVFDIVFIGGPGVHAGNVGISIITLNIQHGDITHEDATSLLDALSIYRSGR